MEWIDRIKESLPDYAKDTKLNLDAVLKRSTLVAEVAEGCALAAVFATGNGKLVSVIMSSMTNEKERNAALTAATLMAQNNVYYPYNEMVDNAFNGMPAGLRMNAIANHGGTSKENFEAYSLAASIVGKCHFCVKAHYETLKNAGYTVNQLQDIGRIAAVMTSASRVLNS